MKSTEDKDIITQVTAGEYKYGFVTDIETETIPRGLNEDVIRLISSKKMEPDWLLEFRLKAFRHWQCMEKPQWAQLDIPEIDYQKMVYYAAPKSKSSGDNEEDIDPDLLKTFEKLGIPLQERKQLAGMAVDAVMDSVSVKTTFKESLAKKGIIFCSFSEGVQEHPELIKRYLGSVVPYTDNYYAALNCAVFSDGSFVYIPKGCVVPWSCQPISELMPSIRVNLSAH